LPLEGIKSYKPRTIAYRNDFCVSCDGPRRAHLIRSFKAYQIYYIPVVPLGFWREWLCSECGKDPHVYSRELRRMRWGMVMLTGFFSIAGVVASLDQESAIATRWLLRLLFPALFFGALWFALRKKPEPSVREKLKEVSPNLDNTCALCDGALVQNHGWRCSECHAERTAVIVE